MRCGRCRCEMVFESDTGPEVRHEIPPDPVHHEWGTVFPKGPLRPCAPYTVQPQQITYRCVGCGRRRVFRSLAPYAVAGGHWEEIVEEVVPG